MQMQSRAEVALAAAALTVFAWWIRASRLLGRAAPAPAGPASNSSDAPPRDEVEVTEHPIPIGSLAARVCCPTAGAISIFTGTTRDTFEGKDVLRLEVSMRCCQV